jgi:hypothetical protein
MPDDPKGGDGNQGAPWSKDLETAFADENVRAQVDAFLRQTVQPHITQLEQATRPNRDAQRLYDAFRENPIETYVAVAQEILPDKAEQIGALVEGKATPPPASGESEEEESSVLGENENEGGEQEGDQEIDLTKLPPEIREIVEERQQSKVKTAYDERLDQLIEDHADDLPKDKEGKAIFNRDIFHPFVAATGGDFEAALQGYQKHQKETLAAFGIEAKEGDEPAGDPPPVIDTTTRVAPGQTPPQEIKHESLDDAIDGFLEDNKKPVPTVGSV